MSWRPCICFSSRSGALVVAGWQLFASALMAIVHFKNIELLQADLDKHQYVGSDPKDWKFSWDTNGSITDLGPGSDVRFKEGLDKDQEKIFSLKVWGAVNIALNILFVSFLIHGIRTNNLCLLKTYIIANTITLVVSITMTVVDLATKYDSFYAQLLPYFLKAYCIFVVYCAYGETREKLSPMNEFMNGYGYSHPLDMQGGGVQYYSDSYPEPVGVQIGGAPYTPQYYAQPMPPVEVGASSYPPQYYAQSMPPGQVGASSYPPQYYPQQVGTCYPQQQSQQQRNSFNPTELNPPQPNPAAEGTAGAMTAMAISGMGGGAACTIM